MYIVYLDSKISKGTCDMTVGSGFLGGSIHTFMYLYIVLNPNLYVYCIIQI